MASPAAFFYCDGNWIRLIEGPPEPLRRLYASICADTRHACIVDAGRKLTSKRG
jgi:hypothetical protein